MNETHCTDNQLKQSYCRVLTVLCRKELEPRELDDLAVELKARGLYLPLLLNLGPYFEPVGSR